MGAFLERNPEDFNVSEEDWQAYGHKMIRRGIEWRNSETR